MLQVNYIRENREKVLERLRVRQFKQIQLIDQIISVDEERRQTQTLLDSISAEANVAAKQIGELIRCGQKNAAEAIKAETASGHKQKIKTLEEKLTALEEKQHSLMVQVPNLPHHLVKEGVSAEDNEVVLIHGRPAQLPTTAMPHWDLAAKYDIIDFELGAKITGAGFPVYKGKGAKLQRALINFFLDRAIEAGYKEVQAPYLVNATSGFGTGHIPDKEEQMYHVGLDDLFLVPTGEVPITNLYRDVILKEEDFPIKNAGYTPCFRREAGSYGAHVRGLNRLHQFDKVEIVQITHPDKSYDTLNEMSAYVQSLLKELGLHYRILRLCGGDMGFSSAMTYDMEVWSGVQQRWLEVSSVSNFETYQSNRLKLRFKGKEGKMQLAHTLNGSALALPRIVASVLENYQTEKGILIPKALQNYTGFSIIG